METGKQNSPEGFSHKETRQRINLRNYQYDKETLALFDQFEEDETAKPVNVDELQARIRRQVENVQIIDGKVVMEPIPDDQTRS